MRKNSKECEKNSEFIEGIIEKYSEKKLEPPIQNVSIDVETDDNQYTIIRLNDEQFHKLSQSRLSISDDYWHLMHLADQENLIYYSFPKMYVAMKLLFGESGEHYDDWKGSFSFPFLISFQKNGLEYEYLMNVYNFRKSIEFRVMKLIPASEKSFDRTVEHKPFDEFPKTEINNVISYFVGYLTGAFEILSLRYDTPFFKVVESENIIFGYKEGCFFEEYYDEDEFYDTIRQLKKRLK